MKSEGEIKTCNKIKICLICFENYKKSINICKIHCYCKNCIEFIRLYGMSKYCFLCNNPIIFIKK